MISLKLKRAGTKDKPQRGVLPHQFNMRESKDKKERLRPRDMKGGKLLDALFFFYYWFTISLILFLNACLGPEKQDSIDCQQYQILLSLFSGATENRARIRVVQEPSDFIQAIFNMRFQDHRATQRLFYSTNLSQLNVFQRKKKAAYFFSQKIPWNFEVLYLQKAMI